MRVKLSYKIFGAFLAVAFLIVVLMVASIRFVAYRSFTDFVNQVEMEKLSRFIDTLGSEYRETGGWQRLTRSPANWRALFRKSTRALPPPAPEDSEEREPAPLPTPVETVLQKEGLPPPPRDAFRVSRRLFLLNADKQLIAGRPRTAENDTLQAIVVDGRTVGWLGLEKRPPHKTPLEVAFLRRQYTLFYLIGGGILLLTGLVTFVLSRHLLAPIKQLTDGTRALAARQFDKRIQVHSGDELGQLAADFNQMAQSLEQSEGLRRQWLSDIAHELRTPLSILRGEIEAIQDGVRALNPDTLASLHSEVQHLSKLVADLHELSLAESGAMVFRQIPLDPLAVARDTLRLFRTRFEQAGMSLRSDLENTAKANMMGDPDRLTQLFSNLFENILRHAERPGTVTIRHRCTNDRLSLEVADSGPGVPPDALPRLFDRLYRVNAARTRNSGGSGLGLAICKSIVSAHGGRIRALESAAGGLCIAVVLPLAAGAKPSEKTT